ncbi:P-loop containing nucleoside triphosphate hydrolase, partial [Arabidopsis thaliana x Arabidopsis arenosa]
YFMMFFLMGACLHAEIGGDQNMADRELLSVTNIVLVGRNGNGKSFTGNTLLDEKLVISKADAGGATMEENDKLKEKEREIESKSLAEAEVIAMKEKSRMEHEHTMNMMAHEVEHALKQNAETHEKETQHHLIDVSNTVDEVLIKDRPHRFGVIVAQLSNHHLLLFCVFYCFCFFYFCIFPTLL